MLGGNLAVAAGQHLTHRRVIVAAHQAFDIEPPIFAALLGMMVIHHAGRLGGFAHGVAHIEALDTKGVEIVLIQTEHLGQRTGTTLLGALLGQDPRQRQARVLTRLLEPATPRATRLAHPADGMSRASLQQSERIGISRLGAADNHRWQLAIRIVLRQEGIEHLARHLLGDRIDMGREMCPIAKVPPATDHGQVHTDPSPGDFDRNDVDIDIAACFHRLLMQDPRERGHAITQHRRFLEPQLGGRRMHARFEIGQDLLMTAAQEAHRGIGVGAIGGFIDGLHAGRTAAPDLMQQAGTRAVGKHRVFTGSQPEHFLQDLDAFLDRPGARIGTEELAAPVGDTSVVGNPGKPMRAELEHRIGLVVAKQNVVARLLGLDEIVFEQQRFGFRTGDRGLYPRDSGHHMGDARTELRLLEVGRHTLLEIARLADIEQRAIGGMHAVDTRQPGQGHQEGLGVKLRR